DYYQLVWQRLNENGVHSQWIPIYSLTGKNLQEILKAFYDVFPKSYVWYINSTINPYIVITGKKGEGSISFEDIRVGMSLPDPGKDLASIGVTSPYAILDYFLFGPKGLAAYVDDVDPHSDDRMTVEYESSRVLNRQTSWWNN